MRTQIFIVGAMVAWSLAPVAQATPESVFAQADQLYSQRENNVPAIEQARTLYRQILDDSNSSNADKIRAGKQLGRLAIYQGDMLTPKTDTQARKSLFSTCWRTDMDKIHPSKVGENGAYYYFKGACLGFWGEVVPAIEGLLQINNLLSLVEKGGATDELKNFEAGGNFRLQSGLHSNKKAEQIPLPSGKLYDPPRSVNEAKQALASPGLIDSDTGNQISGLDFYENWHFLARAYAATGDTANQKKTLEDAIRAIQDAQATTGVPADRVPEANAELKMMQADLQALGG